MNAGHPLVRLTLAPVVMAQGLMVRRRARLLPEPEGARRGRAGQGAPLRLLILGDSSAAGVGARHQDQALSGQLAARLGGFTLDWRLEAATGATTRSTLARLDALADDRFDLAVVALGVNDVTRQVPLRRWLRDQARLASDLRGRFGVRRVYLSGLPPMADFPLLPQPLAGFLGARAALLDRALAAQVAGDPALRHVPFDPALMNPALMAADGFHPGSALYALWAEALAALIRADFEAS